MNEEEGLGRNARAFIFIRNAYNGCYREIN